MASSFIINKGPGIASKAYNYVKNIIKPKKTYGAGEAINKMPVAKDLKKTRDLQEDMVKFRDKLFKGRISEEGKIDVKTKSPMSRYLRNQNILMGKKLATGGRVGLKRGTGLMSRKSNIQKIKETFGPRVSKNKKTSNFGMLSVKAGIDKNPNPTQADRIAGAKMKNKKRFV